jgi:hypothetical protein
LWSVARSALSRVQQIANVVTLNGVHMGALCACSQLPQLVCGKVLQSRACDSGRWSSPVACSSAPDAAGTWLQLVCAFYFEE